MNLASIAPATKTVALGSAAVEVTGLSLRRITQLIVEYPDLLSFVAGGKIDFASMLVNAPNMALAIFAVGVVGPAQPRFFASRHLRISEGNLLETFDKAAIGQQLEILATVVDLTFKGGERALPFLRSVMASLATSTNNSRPEPAPNATPTPDESKTSVDPTPTSSSD